MKTGLFLALLVLFASTNVFAQDEGSDQSGDNTDNESNNRLSDGLRKNVLTAPVIDKPQRQPTQRVTGSSRRTRPGTIVTQQTAPVNTGAQDTSSESLTPETGTVTTITKETRPVAVIRPQTVSGAAVNQQTVPGAAVNQQTVPGAVVNQQTVPGAAVNQQAVPGAAVNQQTVPGSNTPGWGSVTPAQTGNLPDADAQDGTEQDANNSGSGPQTDSNGTPDVNAMTDDSGSGPQTDTNGTPDVNAMNDDSGSGPQTDTNGTPDVNAMNDGSERPQGPSNGQRILTTVTPVIDSKTDGSPNAVNPASGNTVHVSGSIILVKHRSSVVNSVQYDIDGSRLNNGGRSAIQPQVPFAQDFLARRSRVTLYVSTSKTVDPKLAFAQFPIRRPGRNFPLSFDIDVLLPTQQRGLLDRADITLYFFVYIQNRDTLVNTFLPAGTSQILLQGTNRLAQRLDVYVRTSGLEITGLFRSRYSQGFIRPGTSFQVLIVPEQSLALLNTPSFDVVGQITINNVPAMFPVPFSLLVPNQLLKPNTKYFAVAYIFQNGIPRLLNQEPIYVINEQRLLVAPQVIFTVIPSPFILRGVVTRSMPGSFFLQPRSSLILRFHEIGSDSRDIIFKLPNMATLPQVFQVNMSQAVRFDPSKNYDIRALITDEKNDIYMANLQPIPLLDGLSKLVIPVDDLLYYVQARLQSSSNQNLRYIPGSTAQIFVTDSPEAPTQPIVAVRLDSIGPDFREFSIKVPATAIQRGQNYYLVMLIENNGIITHVSKTLLISNNQRPPLLIQLPVLSLNVISGTLFDVQNRPAQWSSSSFASLFLLDDRAENPDKAIVQVWKIHLENDFPVRFEVQLDFSLLRPDRVYRLQAAIENGRNGLEYKPAGSVLALQPYVGILSDIRIPVRNVRTSQTVSGLIYINDLPGPFPEQSEIVVQISSSPSLINPSIIDQIRIPVAGRTSPIDFTMKLPFTKIDINSVYYFLVRYVVRDNPIIPSTQAFAFSPRNEATVVLTLSKTPQIPITGQVTSTGGPLILPSGTTLHLYITDNVNQTKPTIFSEVYLKATPNSLYQFTMNIDSGILQKQIPLYLRADILYQGAVILSIPRPALLQITPGGEWNINLVVDLPTLLLGQIVSMSPQESTNGQFDVFIQIIDPNTKNIVHTSQTRLAANLPQNFRIELDNDLFSRYPNLQAQAVIKNCKGQVLFRTAGAIDIRPGLNVQVQLPVALTDQKKLDELRSAANDNAPINTGIWRLSVTGVSADNRVGLVAGPNNNFALQK